MVEPTILLYVVIALSLYTSTVCMLGYTLAGAAFWSLELRLRREPTPDNLSRHELEPKLSLIPSTVTPVKFRQRSPQMLRTEGSLLLRRGLEKDVEPFSMKAGFVLKSRVRRVDLRALVREQFDVLPRFQAERVGEHDCCTLLITKDDLHQRERTLSSFPGPTSPLGSVERRNRRASLFAADQPI